MVRIGWSGAVGGVWAGVGRVRGRPGGVFVVCGSEELRDLAQDTWLGWRINDEIAMGRFRLRSFEEFQVILQAFRRDTSGWRCVAETGDELDHHALVMMELPSQRTGESWVLAYGNRTGANGRMVRIRAYTFDRAKFSVLWAPPDRLGGEITFADGVVTVRSIDEVRYYELRQPPYNRVEKFLLTVQGVEQLAALPGRQ